MASNSPVDVDFVRVINTVPHTDEFVSAAQDEFDNLIYLDESAIASKVDSGDYSAFLLEWILFDYDIYAGKTTLESFATWPPDGCGTKMVDAYAQAAATHFSSIFRLAGVNKATKKLALENLIDGRTYHVFDRSISESLPEDAHGTMGARLARYNGTWYFPGNIVFHTQGEVGDAIVDAVSDPYSKHGVEFFQLVALRFGQPMNMSGRDAGDTGEVGTPEAGL